MEFNGALARAFDFEHARRAIAVVCDLGVRIVVRENYVVAQTELHRLFKKRAFYRRSGGIVRVVQPQQLGAAGNFFGYAIEVGKEPALLFEHHEVRLTAVEDTARVKDRIPGVRNQHDIPRIDDCGRKVGDSFLGTYQGAHLAPGVELRPETAGIPFGGRFPESFETLVVGIPMVLRLNSGSLEALYNMLGCGKVRIPYTKADNIYTFGLDLFLEPIE